MDCHIHGCGNQDAHRRNEQAVDRIGLGLGELNDARENGRHSHAVHVIAPDHPLQFVEDQDQAVGQQDLIQVIPLVEKRDREALDDPAEHQ